ncbi:MAG: hypothetical protein QM705_06280 [Ancrocorticia sp.]
MVHFRVADTVIEIVGVRIRFLLVALVLLVMRTGGVRAQAWELLLRTSGSAMQAPGFAPLIDGTRVLKIVAVSQQEGDVTTHGVSISSQKWNE